MQVSFLEEGRFYKKTDAKAYYPPSLVSDITNIGPNVYIQPHYLKVIERLVSHLLSLAVLITINIGAGKHLFCFAHRNEGTEGTVLHRTVMQPWLLGDGAYNCRDSGGLNRIKARNRQEHFPDRNEVSEEQIYSQPGLLISFL